MPSGSGKTESLRRMIKDISVNTGTGTADAVGDRVIDAMEILRVLGNASTDLNADSSRYILDLKVR